MSLTVRRVAVTLFVATVIGTRELAGQTPATHQPPGTGGRMLGGHTYVPLSTVPLPFVSTTFSTALGGAVAADVVEAIIVDVGGQLDTLLPQGDLVFGSIEMSFQQRIRTRFAARVGLTGNFRTGTNARLLFAEGLSGLRSVSFGGLAALHRRDRVMVTGVVEYRVGAATELTLQDFAEYVGAWGIDSIDQWGAHLLQERKSSRLLAGVRGAWTLAPWLGLSGSVEGGPANLLEDGSKFAINLGAGGSVDFRHVRGHVPVGVSLGVGVITAPERADDIAGTVTSLGLGLYYTGRDEFAIGLDLLFAEASLLAVDKTVRTTAGRFVLRYDF